MPETLYPMRFEPIFKTVMWGGQTLRPLLGAAPTLEPTGEAWLLSDQGENLSKVADGPLAGRTLRGLMQACPHELIGPDLPPDGRFPLLLKLIDACRPLSVQVHPDDEQARRLEPSQGSLGKTEAWVILRAAADSRLYAGLRRGVGRLEFERALRQGNLADILHSYIPKPGDCVFLEAGTVHAIGAGLVLFEVQQTSDITYRLDDWGRIDVKSGKPRELHIDQALACTAYGRGPCDPVRPSPSPDGQGELLVSCRYFTLDRRRTEQPYSIDAQGTYRVAVCVEGHGRLVSHGNAYPFQVGDAYLLPAAVGVVECIPDEVATLLECGPGPS